MRNTTILFFLITLISTSCHKEKESILTYYKETKVLSVTDTSYYINSIYVIKGNIKDSIFSFVEFSEQPTQVTFTTLSDYQTKDISGSNFQELLENKDSEMNVILRHKNSDLSETKIFKIPLKGIESSERIYGYEFK